MLTEELQERRCWSMVRFDCASSSNVRHPTRSPVAELGDFGPNGIALRGGELAMPLRGLNAHECPMLPQTAHFGISSNCKNRNLGVSGGHPEHSSFLVASRNSKQTKLRGFGNLSMHINNTRAGVWRLGFERTSVPIAWREERRNSQCYGTHQPPRYGTRRILPPKSQTTVFV